MEPYIILILILSGIGIIDTSYLAYHGFKRTDAACLFFPKDWCQKVQYSKESITLGVPNSYLGLFAYLLIFVLAVGYADGLKIPLWWLQIVIGFGFWISLYLTFVQAFILRAFCIWCLISALNFILMTVASYWF